MHRRFLKTLKGKFVVERREGGAGVGGAGGVEQERVEQERVRWAEFLLTYSFRFSVSMSRFALIALSWSIIAVCATPTVPPVFASLVESQLVFVGLISLDDRQKMKAFKLLREYWNRSDDRLIKSLDAILDSGSPHPRGLPLLNMIARHCQSKESMKSLWMDKQVILITNSV